MGRRITVRPGDKIIQNRGIPPWLFWTIVVGGLLVLIAETTPWAIPVAIVLGIMISPWERQTKLGALLFLAISAFAAYVG